MRVSLLLLSLTALLGVDHVRAQADIEIDQATLEEVFRAPLVGIEVVGAGTLIGWSERIEAVTEKQFQTAVGEAFELGLLRAGVRLSSGDDHDHALFCTVDVLGSDTGLVVYSAEVRLLEAVSDNTTSAGYLAQTWSDGAIGSVGEDNLMDTAKTMGTDCAEWFEADWRRANQGG